MLGKFFKCRKRIFNKYATGHCIFFIVYKCKTAARDHIFDKYMTVNSCASDSHKQTAVLHLAAVGKSAFYRYAAVCSVTHTAAYGRSDVVCRIIHYSILSSYLNSIETTVPGNIAVPASTDCFTT